MTVLLFPIVCYDKSIIMESWRNVIMSKRSSLGWVDLIVGVLLIVLGIITFARPSGTLTGMVVVYGLLAIVTGVADIIFYVKMERRTGFGPALSLVTGILSVLAGILLLFHPGAGTWIISFMFPLWFIAHCVSKLTHLPMVRLMSGTGHYYFTLVVNILGLILGFVMLFNPIMSLSAVAYLVGLYLILLGIDSIVIAFSGVGAYRS